MEIFQCHVSFQGCNWKDDEEIYTLNLQKYIEISLNIPIGNCKDEIPFCVLYLLGFCGGLALQGLVLACKNMPSNQRVGLFERKGIEGLR